MNVQMRDKFLGLWRRYFAGAPLPIAFFYSGDDAYKTCVRPPRGQACVIGQLALARAGEVLALDAATTACAGGKRYAGFAHELRPGFEYFLSCGIPGKVEGERYKKSPEIVREMLRRAPKFTAPGKYLVFKRWDILDERDEPAAVVFFARPDVLSGLFTLAGFEESEPESVVAPFAAGCGAIIQHPMLEAGKARPRAVLGMFDVSARPWVAEDELTLSVPMRKFERMVEDMEESFLTTGSWAKVERRIEGGGAAAPGRDVPL